MGTIVTIDPRAEAPFTADDALGMEAYLVIGQNRIEYAARRAEHAAPLFVATTQAVGNTNGNAYGEGGGGMQHLFWEHPILALPYKSTQISIEDGSPFVVTPQDLTDSATAEEWLALSANLTGRRTLTAGLSEERATLIYSVSQELFDFCQRSFSLPHYAHTITSMIRLAVTQTRRATPHIVLIHHQGEQVQVVVAKEGELLLANSYRVASDSDTLYYITALYRQFKLNPQETPLWLYSQQPFEQLLPRLADGIKQIEVNSYPHLRQELLEERDIAQLHPQFILQLLCE